MQLIYFHTAGQQAHASVQLFVMTAQEAGLATSWGLSSCIQHMQPVLRVGAGLRHTSVAVDLRGWRKRASPGPAAAWLWKVKVSNKEHLPLCL